jgi:hypothetical protein
LSLAGTICSPANPRPKVIPDKVYDRISDEVVDLFFRAEINAGWNAADVR